MATRKLTGERLMEDIMGPFKRKLVSRLDVLEDDMTILMWGDDGTPPHRPVCPACKNTRTSWRGPHPGIGLDPPITVDKGGYVFAHVPGRAEGRSDAMMRLYRIADIHKSSPHRMDWVSDGLVLWQSALCYNCDLGHIERWFMEMFERNTNGTYTEHCSETKRRKPEDDPT